jgi:hypothetical protein
MVSSIILWNFICDFVAAMNFIQVDLYNLYVDLKQHFSHG